MGLGQHDAQMLDQGDLQEEAQRRSSSHIGSAAAPPDGGHTIRHGQSTVNGQGLKVDGTSGSDKMAPGHHATPALTKEMHRVKTHYEEHGYLAAPESSDERQMRRLQTM